MRNSEEKKNIKNSKRKCSDIVEKFDQRNQPLPRAACVVSGGRGCAAPAQRFVLLLPRAEALRLERVPARLCSGLGPGFSSVALLAISSRRGMEPLAGVTFLLNELAQRSFFLFFSCFLFLFCPQCKSSFTQEPVLFV